MPLPLPTRCKVWLLAMACLGSFAPTQAVGDSINELHLDDASGRGLSDWTHILWIGPQTHPQPLIWITHTKMRRLGFLETNVVLPISEYRRLQRVQINPYANRPARSIVDDRMGAFRISQRIGSHKTRTYFLSSVGGCGYIAAFLALKGVKWPSSSREEFSQYAMICKIAGRQLPRGY